MRQFLTAGLSSLTLLIILTPQARADGCGFGFSWHASGSFGFSFTQGCGAGGGGCCPNPYAGCAYAPYFQYGWPQAVPVYPGVAPGYGFAPTPWTLPPSPYIGPAVPTNMVAPPYYWSRR